MSKFVEKLRQITPRMERVPWRVDVRARSDQEPHRIIYSVHEGVQWAFHLGPSDEDESPSEVT